MNKKLIVKWFDTIDSTNLQAMRELSDAQEGTVWIADFQTAGRGQRGNSWESVKGKNLTFTLLLKPFFIKASNQFVISQIVALAIIKYLEGKGLAAKIKWPNDIYIGDKKICGILIEHSVEGVNLAASILGIGINLNQTSFATDAPNPTSLILETKTDGQEYDRSEELSLVLSRILSLYEEARSGYFTELEQEYLSYLYRFNEFHTYIETKMEDGAAEENTIEAKIVGIDKNACLILERKDGRRSMYAFKEIKYVL